MRRGLLVALAVVAAVNLGVMLDVRRDRTGEPDAVVTLDERELALEPPPHEGGAIVLRLKYQREAAADAPAFLPYWIDQRKLEALGFDCSVAAGEPGAADRYRSVLPRRVVLVFELGGPVWQARLEAWQRRSRGEVQHLVSTGVLTPDEETAYREAIELAPERVSRLVPVDVGLDAVSLRARYADRGRYLLLHGLVRLLRDEGTGGSGPSLRGRVVQVFPAELTVPREVSGPLGGLEPTVAERPRRETTPRRLHDRLSVERMAGAPRYAVRVEVGHLLRARIVSIAGKTTAR